MNDAQLHPSLFRAIDELQETTGISGGNNFRAGGLDVGEFALQQVIGHFRLNEVVNAGAAAAPVRLGRLDEFQIQNRPQHLSRL